MKTTICTLQGQDFVLTKPAEQVLLQHLKQLQRATRFRPRVYRENVEALRDVLLAEGVKTVSRPKLEAALELVGLPDTHVNREPVAARFPKAYQAVRVVLRPVRKLARNTYHTLKKRGLYLLAGIAIAAGVMYLVAAFVPLHVPRSSPEGWRLIDTTIGPVRYFTDDGSRYLGQDSQRVVGVVSGIVLFIVAGLALRMPFAKHRALYGFAVAAGLLCVLAVQTQTAMNGWLPAQQETAITQPGAIVPTEPVRAQLAYLRQCGDEIPYVFDGATGGMLFRRLRDQGFRLAVPIATRWTDGTIDVAELCRQYDALRRNHATSDIVLQGYTQEADGTIRPYDFSDIENQQVTSGYGLFVKS